MANFPNVHGDLTFNGKSHTNLVVSEGAAPAEDLVISRTNSAEPFIYQYGPEGNQTVVLAKGKIAEIVGTEYDPETGYYKTAVKQAGDASEKVSGVSLHNVYDRRRGAMLSQINKPTLITRNYIEVPLFESEGTASLEAAQVLAEAMKFGAAVSESKVDNLNLKPGDLVVSDRSGNFRKYVKGTDPAEAVIGQVWAKETNLPPAGFLQYYSEMINPELEDYLKAMSHAPSPGIPSQGAGAFPYGHPYSNKGWKPEFEKMLGAKGLSGIPFLTDGFFRSQESRTFELANTGVINENVEAVRGGEGTVFDAETNKVTVKDGVKNAAIFIKLAHKIDQTKLSNVAAQVNSAAVNSRDLFVDVVNNTVVIYLPENETGADVDHEGIELTIPMSVDPIAGLPTEWDFKGSTGAVRILLQK